MKTAPTLPALVAIPEDGPPESLVPVAPPLGAGADAAVYRLRSYGDFVVKLYHDPTSDPNRQAKLRAMLEAPPERSVTAVQGERVVELAWPEMLVTEVTSTGSPRVLGFVMPAVNLSKAVLLEAVLSPRGRRAAKLSDSVRFRVTAAANLAASVAALHAEGHHVIDLKPANLHVYRDSALIALLDCDGMSIRAPDGTRHPAHQYTDGYIAPEAMRRKERPETLGEAQDRFALAVVLFQLLNNGLHPFQGVPVRGALAPTTNGDRIAAGLYPYGSGAHTLTPPPASPFPFLDPRTQALFQRAFDSSPDARPSAAEWRDHLREVLDATLTPCPEHRDHARYGDKLCATCELDPVLRKRRRLAAYAARRGAQFPDHDEVDQEDVDRFSWMVKAALPVIAILILTGYAIGNTALGFIDLLSGELSRTSLTLNEAIATHGAAEVWDAMQQSSEADILRTGEAAFEWPYGTSFELDEVWNGTRELDPLPSQGLPPIHRASYESKPYVVSLFLTRDLDVDARDASSRTPLMYAAAAQIAPNSLSPEISATLIDRIQETAAERRYRSGPQIVRSFASEPEELMLYGLDIRTLITSSRRHTRSIHHAVADQSMTLCALLDAGADINAQDRWGRTALAYAAVSGNGAGIAQLLSRGANPNLADQAGITPLMLVADRLVHGPSDSLGVELVSLLLYAGADASITDRSGRTAADFVGSPTVPEGWSSPLTSSKTLALLHATTLPIWSARAPWLYTATPPFEGRAVDASRAADVGDLRTDYGTPESVELAASFPAPPWNATVRVACRNVASDQIRARLELAMTPNQGVAKPIHLDAPEWLSLPELTAEEREKDPDLRAQRDRTIRSRERCLVHALSTLPRRFDVREADRLVGDVQIIVTNP